MNAMEGAALAANRRLDVAIVTAWHTAIFGLSGYAGELKGKKLSDYLTSPSQPADNRRAKHAQALAFFHTLKARGFGVEITRH